MLVTWQRSFSNVQRTLWNKSPPFYPSIVGARGLFYGASTSDVHRHRFAYVPRYPSYLRHIKLPDTWRGRRTAEKTREHWETEFKESTGKEPPLDAPGKKGPLMLFVDERPTTTRTELRSDGILFDRRNPFGQNLWRVANPIRWSERPRWIRWLTYSLVGLYSGLLLYWLLHRDRVPTTGRRQFRFSFIHHPSPPILADNQEIVTHDELKKFLLPDNHPQVVRIR